MDVGEEGFHAAGFDVRVTARVFVSMMGKVELSNELSILNF